MKKTVIILSCGALLASAMPAQADQATVRAELTQLVEKKEKALSEKLQLTREQETGLANLQAALEEAKVSKRRSLKVGITLGTVGALITIIGAEAVWRYIKLRPSNQHPVGGVLELLVSALVGPPLAVGGAGLSGGMLYYMHVKAEKLDELLGSVQAATAALERSKQLAEDERLEIELLKRTLNQ